MVVPPSERGAGLPETVCKGDAEGVGTPESGSTGAEPVGAEPPIGSIGLAIGICTALSADEGIATGTVAGEDVSPIGAIEIFLYGVESLAGAGGSRESVGGPPKLFPSSRKFRELSGTTRFVPSG